MSVSYFLYTVTSVPALAGKLCSWIMWHFYSQVIRQTFPKSYDGWYPNHVLWNSVNLILTGRLGSWLAMTLVATKNILIYLSHPPLPPYFSLFPLSQHFLIEGVLRSKTYWAKVDGSSQKIRGAPFQTPFAILGPPSGHFSFCILHFGALQAVGECPWRH